MIKQWTLEQVSIHNPINNEIKTKETHIIEVDNFIPFEISKSQFNKKRYISVEDLFKNIHFHNKINYHMMSIKLFLEESATTYIMLYYGFHRSSFFIY